MLVSVPTRCYRMGAGCKVGGGEATAAFKMRRRTMCIGLPQQWHISLGRTALTVGDASAGTLGLRRSAIARRSATPRRQHRLSACEF